MSAPGPQLRALLDKLGPRTEAHINRIVAEAPTVDQMSPERRAHIAAVLLRRPLHPVSVAPPDAA